MTADLEVLARSASVEDLAAIAEIRASQIEAVAENRGGGLLGEQDRSLNGSDHLEHLQAALASDDHELVVGALDGYPFGYGLMSISQLEPGRLLAVVEDLVVEPEARHVGLGETVMTELVERAKARGCFGIDSRALPGDRETKNFFESFGLKARLLVVHRKLDEL